MGYNAYNTDDDTHLIEYLATYNSDGKARKGNALYKQLSENVRANLVLLYAQMTRYLTAGQPMAVE